MQEVLLVKNMVCQSCLLAVEDVLKRLAIPLGLNNIFKRIK